MSGGDKKGDQEFSFTVTLSVSVEFLAFPLGSLTKIFILAASPEHAPNMTTLLLLLSSQWPSEVDLVSLSSLNNPEGS